MWAFLALTYQPQPGSLNCLLLLHRAGSTKREIPVSQEPFKPGSKDRNFPHDEGTPVRVSLCSLMCFSFTFHELHHPGPWMCWKPAFCSSFRLSLLDFQNICLWLACLDAGFNPTWFWDHCLWFSYQLFWTLSPLTPQHHNMTCVSDSD